MTTEAAIKPGTVWLAEDNRAAAKALNLPHYPSAAMFFRVDSVQEERRKVVNHELHLWCSVR